jgi:hypothetical protein
VGGIRNWAPKFGIADRGVGGGVVSILGTPEALEALLIKTAAAKFYALKHLGPGPAQERG